MVRLQGAIARRAAWSFSAQAISSTSNFILTISVLAVSSRREFAVFSLCITTYLLVSQLARSAASFPLMILYSEHREPDSGQQAAVGVGVLIGIVAAAILLAVSAAVGAGAEQYLILGLAMPLLLFQDSARYLSFARADPQVAAISDGLWLVLQVAGSLAAWSLGAANAAVLLAVWAAAGAAAGLFAALRLKVAPVFAGSVRWLGEHRQLWGKLVVEFVLNSGSFYLLLYGLAFLAGVDELADLRAAQTLIGPVIVVLLAGQALGIPESVRMRRDFRKLKRLCLFFSVSLAGAAVVWGFTVFVALPYIGPTVFPASWETARPLIPSLTVFAAAVGISTGAGSGLRALGENDWIMRARAVTGAIALLVGLPLAPSIGAYAVLIALAGTESLFAAASWVRLAGSAGGTPDPDGEELESFVPF